MDNMSSMYLYVKLTWDANRFLPAESKDSMKYRYSTSIEICRLGEGMPIICFVFYTILHSWHILPYPTKMLYSLVSYTCVVLFVYLTQVLFLARLTKVLITSPSYKGVVF